MAVQVTTIATATTETTIITAGTAGVNNALTGLIITTLNAVLGTLTVRDSTGGTTRLLIDYPAFTAAAAPGVPFIFFFPKDQILFQAAPAQNWTIQASVNASGYKINAFYIEM